MTPITNKYLTEWGWVLNDSFEYTKGKLILDFEYTDNGVYNAIITDGFNEIFICLSGEW